MTDGDLLEEPDLAELEFHPLTLAHLKMINPGRYKRKRKIHSVSAKYANTIAGFNLINVKTKYYVNARDIFLKTVAQAGSGNEGILLAIYGDSHSGKTHILNRLHMHKDLQPTMTEEGLVLPIVYLTAPPATTTKSLGIAILSTLNRISTSNGGTEFDDFSKLSRPPSNLTIWTKVLSMLKHFETEFLIVDEIHNVLIGPTARDNSQATAMTIKELLNNHTWSLNVVISGTTVLTKQLIAATPELGNRIKCVEIKPIGKVKAGLAEIRDFVTRVEKQLGLPDKHNLDFAEMPDRFWLATQGHRGKIARLIFDAAAEAYAAIATGVTAKGLAAVLAENTNVLFEANPFNLQVKLEKLNEVKWPDEDQTTMRGKASRHHK